MTLIHTVLHLNLEAVRPLLLLLDYSEMIVGDRYYQLIYSLMDLRFVLVLLVMETYAVAVVAEANLQGRKMNRNVRNHRQCIEFRTYLCTADSIDSNPELLEAVEMRPIVQLPLIQEKSFSCRE